MIVRRPWPERPVTLLLRCHLLPAATWAGMLLYVLRAAVAAIAVALAMTALLTALTPPATPIRPAAAVPASR